MSINISTNTAALRAGSYLAQNNTKLQRSFDRLASGRKLSSPIEDPGGLAVSMKLSASINRLAGAQNNVQNAQSFLEVQDGMLDTVGRIIDRMSELKGLASQDPMKSDQDRASYNNEFRDLQVQLYNISQQTFNGVSLFANHVTKADGTTDSTTQILFSAENTTRSNDNTLTIFTSTEGSAGSKVSVFKSSLLSALTLQTNKDLAGEVGATAYWSLVNADNGDATNKLVTFAASEIGNTISLGQISVGVITQALENVSYLRAQNGGSQSRLAFNLESLTQQKTNMRAALGRIVDVDIAEESTNVAKYSILNQAAASMLAQANASSDVALMLLR
jgi:flagellin